MSEIKKVDLEVMQLKNKRGLPIHDEAEHIMDIIQECQVKLHQENKSFIVDIYDILSRCINYHGNWICYSCSNENGNESDDTRIKSINKVSEMCTLCGIDSLCSIKLSLNGNNTYTMLAIKKKKEEVQNPFNSMPEYYKPSKMNGIYGSYHYTKYESYILPHPKIDISCPNIINNKYCPHMVRLCKKIKHYQKWIETVKQHKGKHDIATTAKINLHLLDNESFKQIILKSAKLLPPNKQIDSQAMA
eukprot:384354_1